MKVLKTIYEAIVYSNLWISSGAVCFTWFGATVLNYSVISEFVGFIFCTTLFTYNFQRIVKLYFESAQLLSGPRAEWMIQNKSLVLAVTILSGIFGLIFGWQILYNFWWLLIIIGFFSLFYVWKVPLLNRNLRGISGLKIFILGFTWVLACQILPFMLFSNMDFDLPIISFFTGCFLYMVAISIPFDIRDVKLDDNSLRTIPQILGIKRAKNLSVLLILLSTLLITVVNWEWHLGILLNMCLSLILVSNTTEDKKELFYSGLVDGLLISLCICYVFFSF